QIALIENQAMRILLERQSEAATSPIALPETKDPEVTARWTERCLSGLEPVPESLKTQMACVLVASGEAQDIPSALARIAQTF
ncbi:MAG: DNA-binding protein YbiB, partial [Cronobacter sakazakii]|nr:DNA-binding protein YbiB [Cronobacter sakazakii]